MANTIARVSNAAGQFTVLESAARTASPDTCEYEVAGYRGLTLVIDATASAATPSVVVTVLGVDRASGKTWTLLVSAAITGAGTTVLRIGPGLTAAANLVASDLLPPAIRIQSVHGDADSLTYSIGASLSL